VPVHKLCITIPELQVPGSDAKVEKLISSTICNTLPLSCQQPINPGNEKGLARTDSARGYGRPAEGTRSRAGAGKSAGNSLYRIVMLPKPFRMHAQKDIVRILRVGRKYESAHLRVFIAQEGRERSRAAVVIKSGLIKKAQKRNFWKRRMREAARQLFAALQQPCDVMLFLKAVPPQGTTSRNLFDEVRRALPRTLLT